MIGLASVSCSGESGTLGRLYGLGGQGAGGGSNDGGNQQGTGSYSSGTGSGTSSGGYTSTGGASSTGGITSSGGNLSTGGSSTGGTTNTSCTDTPPPNGDTCQHAVEYHWCGANWMNGACARSCGQCNGGTGGSSTGGTSGTGGTGGTSGTGGTGGVVNGQSGWASRYWDCCKAACGWKDHVSAGNPTPSCSSTDQSLGSNYAATSSCDGGSAYMCWNAAPWSVSTNLSYGFAAASGGNFVCGRCYQFQFTGVSHNGGSAGQSVVKGKQMIVQVINNGGVAADQFDILIPGGGVGAVSNQACTTQFGSDLGAQYGGYLTECNGSVSCARTKCSTAFANKPDLLAGCNWFLDWFGGADNPNLVFQKVACPAAITQKSGLSDPG